MRAVAERGQGRHHRRPGPDRPATSRPGRRGPGPGRAGPAAHLHRHQPHPHGAQAAHDPRPRFGRRPRAPWQGAKGYTDDVEFSAEDATRSDPEFLSRVYAATIVGRGHHLQRPRHRGYMHARRLLRARLLADRREPPAPTGRLERPLPRRPGHGGGQSISAVQAGARQVEVAVNGIGERAGNCSTGGGGDGPAHAATSPRWGCRPRSTPARSPAPSRLVSLLTGYPIQPNKAIVGANAFAHESGIHQHGVLMERTTYEHMDPSSWATPGRGSCSASTRAATRWPTPCASWAST